MKKYNKLKPITIIVIIVTMLSSIIMHELISVVVRVIQFPITLGMIGGFIIGFIYHATSSIKK